MGKGLKVQFVYDGMAIDHTQAHLCLIRHTHWRSTLAVLLLLISGCATSPPISPWAGLSVETDPAIAAMDCGSFPAPSEATNAFITYDKAGVNALEAYRVCSEANQANVDEHAAQILQLKIARQGLTEAGQAQWNIAEMRQQMLEDERRHHFWQNIGYWVVIGAMGVAL